MQTNTDKAFRYWQYRLGLNDTITFVFALKPIHWVTFQAVRDNFCRSYCRLWVIFAWI